MRIIRTVFLVLFLFCVFNVNLSFAANTTTSGSAALSGVVKKANGDVFSGGGSVQIFKADSSGQNIPLPNGYIGFTNGYFTYNFETDGKYVVQVYPDFNLEVGNSKEITLNVENGILKDVNNLDAKQIDFVLEEVQFVAKITYPDGTLPTMTSAFIENVNFGLSVIKSDGQGNFAISGMKNERYIFRATYSNQDIKYTDSFEETVNVDINGAADKKNIEFKLTQPQITGLIKDHNNVGLKNQYILVKGSDGKIVKHIYTNLTGNFVSGGLLDGIYSLDIIDSMFGAPFIQNIAKVSIKNGIMEESGKIEYIKNNQKLTVSVKNTKGELVTQASINLKSIDENLYVYTSVNEFGEVILDSLPDGNYSINANFRMIGNYGESETILFEVKDGINSLGDTIKLTQNPMFLVSVKTPLDQVVKYANGQIISENNTTGNFYEADINGEFKVYKIPDGNYSLKVYTKNSESPFASSTVNFTISNGIPNFGNRLEIKLSNPMLKISVKTVDNLIVKSANILLTNANWETTSINANYNLNDNGECYIEKLKDGEYNITVYPEYSKAYVKTQSKFNVVEGIVNTQSALTLILNKPMLTVLVKTPELERMTYLGSALIAEDLASNTKFTEGYNISANREIFIEKLKDGKYILKIIPDSAVPYVETYIKFQVTNGVCSLGSRSEVILNKYSVKVIVKNNEYQILPHIGRAQILNNFGNVVYENLINHLGIGYFGNFENGSYTLRIKPWDNTDYCNTDIKFEVVNGIINLGNEINVTMLKTQLKVYIQTPEELRILNGSIKIVKENGEWNIISEDSWSDKIRVGGLSDGKYKIIGLSNTNLLIVESTPASIEVKNGVSQILNLNLILQKPMILGQVANNNILNCEVNILQKVNDNYEMAYETITTQDGRYAIKSLANGNYIVKILRPSKDDVYSRISMTEIKVLNGEVYNINNQKTNQIYSQFGLHQLSGFVKDSSGIIKNDFTLKLKQIINNQKIKVSKLIQVDRINGKFYINGITEGQYVLWATTKNNEIKLKSDILNISVDKELRINVSKGTAKDIILILSPITAKNTLPVIAPIKTQIIKEGKKISFTIKATDEDGDLLTYFISQLPTGASLSTTTGLFTWTPNFKQAGIYNLEVYVKDENAGSDYKSFTIEVKDNKSKIITKTIKSSIGDLVSISPTGPFLKSTKAYVGNLENLEKNGNLKEYPKIGVAKWIWNGNYIGSRTETVYFTKSVSIPNEAIKIKGKLKITADDLFEVDVNNKSYNKGIKTTWKKIYSFDIDNLLNGKNNLMFKVTELNPKSPSGLIYSMVISYEISDN